MLIFQGVIGGLGPVVWDSTGNPQESQSRIHFRGSNRNPNHKRPQTTNLPLLESWGWWPQSSWWLSFIVHHESDALFPFWSLPDVSKSKIVNHPDLPFLFFFRDAFFFGFAKIVPAAFRYQKKLLVRFAPAMLRPLVLVLVLWPAMGEVTCSEETTLVQRRHRTTRGRNSFPQGPCCFWALAVEDSENSSATKDHYDT